MEISAMAKERFCKDCNIPIRLFQEPYFEDRLKLYDNFFGTLKKWDIFVNELKKYHCEQDYFEEYNRIKDAAIYGIKSSEAYKRFNSEDMRSYHIYYVDFPATDIFKSTNDGKNFISIDMKKANFSSLQHYDRGIFGGAETWEDFIGDFTDNRHIVNSKYIRQVILGNCNPRRHITYEKFLMYGVLDIVLFKSFLNKTDVCYFSNDEIVFDVTFKYENAVKHIKVLDELLKDNFDIPFRVELFSLHKINGTDGYYKKIYKSDGEYNIEFKGVNNYIFPFVMRKLLGEEVTENDRVFYHEGLLSKFIEIPNIEI